MPEGLKELYIDELKDLYSAESQLVKALPKIAKAASSDELRQGFEEHLEQTKRHVQRLEKIFQALGESPKGKKCKGMEGLIEEGSEVMEEDYEGSVLDAALIGAAQRVEHYEIAGYGTVRSMAETLGESNHVSLLKETLEEEKETDEKLSELAAQINTTANERVEKEAMREQGKKSKRVA
jgi:ferritin-like metal-binding protein YciE